MNSKPEKYTAPANAERAQADAERARSGAWGTHQDKRRKRARTRAAAKRRAMREE